MGLGSSLVWALCVCRNSSSLYWGLVRLSHKIFLAINITLCQSFRKSKFKPGCRHQSVNWLGIHLLNGLPPGKDLTWTNADLLSVKQPIVSWTLGNKCQWNWNQNTMVFIQGKAFCILSALQVVHLATNSFFKELLMSKEQAKLLPWQQFHFSEGEIRVWPWSIRYWLYWGWAGHKP